MSGLFHLQQFCTSKNFISIRRNANETSKHWKGKHFFFFCLATLVLKRQTNYQVDTESVEGWKRRNKSFSQLWSDIFIRNLLSKMLIYPLHCRLPPPALEMWLFLDGQGNFDPLRLLWSITLFNRSSAQEFKLILSQANTAPLLRFPVKAKAPQNCQSCWQPAELKALSCADLHCKWLTANGLQSFSFLSFCKLWIRERARQICLISSTFLKGKSHFCAFFLNCLCNICLSGCFFSSSCHTDFT